MSAATRVPETWELTGDDARRTLSQVGRARLLKDAFVRFRAADGTSHSRSLAFMGSLVLVQGLIVAIGIAALVGSEHLTRSIADTAGAAAPGPASDVLTNAVRQAGRIGHGHRYLPLILGLAALLVTATTAMGQVERGLNRIYGVEQDRPTLEKYGRAFLLALATGSLLGVGFPLLALGARTGSGWGHEARIAWEVLRWPIALVLVAAGLAALLRFSPYRHQPGPAWLVLGAGIAVTLWALATLGLALGFHLASTFPRTYGPLAGVVALQLWTFVSAAAVFYGVSVAAQLEAVRAGVTEARDESAVESPAAERAPILST